MILECKIITFEDICICRLNRLRPFFLRKRKKYKNCCGKTRYKKHEEDEYERLFGKNKDKNISYGGIVIPSSIMNQIIETHCAVKKNSEE